MEENEKILHGHLLTTKNLESFAKHRADESQTLVQDVLTNTQKGETLHLREILGDFSMNNATRMLLGKQYIGDESAGPQEAKEIMHITHELFWLLGVIYLGYYLPLWRWIDPHRCEKKMREVEKRIDDFHMRIIEEHRKKGEDEGDGNGKQHMDDVEIKALMQV
ncbi:cytochrome P450 703A2-like [Nicotiana tabacum]|uniref:Cytochrome P450 703A2-like n=1 Tax=Nicotiana tabacum TaxID=4097 RepID=A0AC58TWS9_TOBAC